LVWPCQIPALACCRGATAARQAAAVSMDSSDYMHACTQLHCGCSQHLKAVLYRTCWYSVGWLRFQLLLLLRQLLILPSLEQLITGLQMLLLSACVLFLKSRKLLSHLVLQPRERAGRLSSVRPRYNYASMFDTAGATAPRSQ
jgi:hypothetical protein